MSTIRSDTGPFTLIPEWVLDAQISAQAVRLYAVLGRYADTDGHCHPSRASLADRMGVSDRTVDRALEELVAVGAVTVRPRRSESGGQTSNDYQLNRANPSPPLDTSDEPPSTPASHELEPLNEREGELKTSSPSRASEVRDELFEAIYEAWIAMPYAKGAPLTKDARGRLTKATTELRDVGATPGQVRERAAEYRRQHPDWTFSPQALTSWWGTLESKRERVARRFG